MGTIAWAKDCYLAGKQGCDGKEGPILFFKPVIWIKIIMFFIGTI